MNSPARLSWPVAAAVILVASPLAGVLLGHVLMVLVEIWP